MDSDDLLLCLQHLGLTAGDLAELVSEDPAKVGDWMSGAAPVPRTIDLLTYYWCEFPGALDMAREASDAPPPVADAPPAATPAIDSAWLQ